MRPFSISLPEDISFDRRKFWQPMEEAIGREDALIWVKSAKIYKSKVHALYLFPGKPNMYGYVLCVLDQSSPKHPHLAWVELEVDKTKDREHNEEVARGIYDKLIANGIQNVERHDSGGNTFRVRLVQDKALGGFRNKDNREAIRKGLIKDLIKAYNILGV